MANKTALGGTILVGASGSDRAPALRPKRRWWLLAVGVATMAASGFVGFHMGGRAHAPASAAQRGWHGKITKLVHGGSDPTGGLTAEAPGAARVVLAQGAQVGPGTKLVTDGKTQARIDFDDGSSLTIDRATELTLGTDPRAIAFKDGSILMEVAQVDGAPGCVVTTTMATVRTAAAKLALTALDDRTSVEVLRGDVVLEDLAKVIVRVGAGEEGVAAKGQRLEVAAANDLGQRVAFGELGTTHNEDTDAPVSGLGELRARRPGSRDEKDHAVRLARHDVKIRVVGNVARTEIDETFANDTDQELEGVYKFPLPPGALIEKLSLEVEGKLVDGSFVDKAKGAAIWRGVIQNATPNAPKPKEELIWVPGPWRDPALLEWQRGGRSELKIFPIPKRGARRVVLAYTETIQPVAGMRRYVYPLPQSTASDMKIDSATFDVQVLGADSATPVRVRGYELTSDAASNGRFAKTVRDFTPSGDLSVEYALADRTTDLTAWAFTAFTESRAPAATPLANGAKPIAAPAPEDPYVTLALRPKLPKWGDARPRDQVIVVDGGRVMFGERFQRAARLAVQMTQEMDRRDRVTVLVCDLACRSLPGGFKAPGSGAAHDVDAFLAGTAPDGASDLVGAVRTAGAFPGHDAQRDLRVVLISGGVASAGYRRPDRVAAEITAALPDARAEVVTVPIGTDADVDMLADIARGGGGVVVPYQPGEKLETDAIDVLSATYGITLRDVELILPDGLYDVAPARLAPMRAGGETLVAARIRGDRVKGDAIVRGKVGGEPFEARYPLDVVSTTDAGNAFVPRLYAAMRIADKERDGGDAVRAELVKLSQRFAVPSKFTSLLVLESEAMFQAFGIDRTNRAPSWSGETDANSTVVASTATPSADPLAMHEGERKKDVGAEKGVGSFGGGGSSDGLAGLAGPGSNFGGSADRAAAPPPPPPATKAPPSPAPTATGAPILPSQPQAQTAPFDDDPAPQRRWAPPRRPGRWMKRVFFRTATITADERPVVAQDKIAAARAALAAAPDERKRFLDLVRLLTKGGSLEETAEVVTRWSLRDPLDADAISARADLLERGGDRAAALRVLGGIAASANGSDAPQILSTLALAYERAGITSQACAFRIASAELRPNDADAVASAVLCERLAGRNAAADRWLTGAKSDAVRNAITVAIPRIQARAPDAVFGDVVADATWEAADGADLDLAIVDPSGTRVAWASRARNVRAVDCTSRSHEGLAITNFSTGTFVVEVVRADGGTTPVRGKIRVTSQGETRVFNFVAVGPRAQVARVDVGMSSQLVPASPQDIGARQM